MSNDAYLTRVLGELDKHTDVPRALGGPVQPVWRVSPSLSEVFLQALSSVSLSFSFFFYFLAPQYSLWHLSSTTRD